jgi:hypothetical protein
VTRSSAAVLAVAATGLFPAVAIASPTLHVKPKRVHAGERVRVFGTVPGCPPGNRVTLISRAFPKRHEFAGVPAVFARVRSNNDFGKRVRIPRSKKPGRYRVTGRCGGGNLGVTRKVVVLAPRS